MKEGNLAYTIQDGTTSMNVYYYPGMLMLCTFDRNTDEQTIACINMDMWRAMNKAVEDCHNG